MKECTPGMATKGGTGPGDWFAGPDGMGDGFVGRKGWEGVSPPVLRVSAGESDAVHWIMAAKEEPVKDEGGGVTPRNWESQGPMFGVPQELRAHTHFLWLSVRVMPWAETLKCTTAGVGRGLQPRAAELARATAWGPVSDSVSTEVR